jgi:hypothetical protein
LTKLATSDSYSMTPFEDIGYPKPESAYPEFDVMAFSLVNDLLFFSCVTKPAYFRLIGMATDEEHWGKLRARAKRCETMIYRIERDAEEDPASNHYEVIALEIESLYRDCLSTAESLLPGATPWPSSLEREFVHKLAELEILTIMKDFMLDQ